MNVDLKPKFFLVGFVFLVFSAVSVFLRQLCQNLYAAGEVLKNPIFSLDYVFNTGAAFNILSQHTWLLVLVTFFVLGFVIFYLVRHIASMEKVELFFYGIFIAGVCSNLFERVCYGGVVDYVNLEFVHFPVFNFSDVLITLGTAFIIVRLLFQKGETE